MTNFREQSHRVERTGAHAVPVARKPPQGTHGQRGAETDGQHGRHGAAEDWHGYPMQYLTERILKGQHVLIREELLKLQELSSAATTQDEEDSRRMRAVRQLLGNLASGVSQQMVEEERLFPRLLHLEMAYLGEGPVPNRPVQAREARFMMEQKHRAQMENLDRICARMEAITEKHDALRQLESRLKALRRLLGNHSSLETRILLGRAVQMETEIFRSLRHDNGGQVRGSKAAGAVTSSF